MTTLRRVLSGVAAAVVIAAVLVGIPVALVTQVGWPLPETLPDPGRVVEAIQLGAIDPTVMANLLAVVVWVVWVQLAWALVVEIVAVARRTPTPRLPVMPGLQRTAASLVTTATLLLSAPTASMAGPVALDDAIAATPAVTQPATSTPSTAAQVSSPTVGLDPAEPTRVIVATARTSWWSLAEQHLGDGARWHQIRALNIGQTMPDGTVVSDTANDVKPEWTIHVPAPDDPPAATPAPPTAAPAAQPANADPSRPGDPAPDVEEMGEWTVEPGDHMWEIAEETLRDELGREPTDAEVTPYWRSVIAANQDNLRPPEDPDLIYPGQVLDVPPTDMDQDVDVEQAKADATSHPAPDRADVDDDDAVDATINEFETSATAEVEDGPSSQVDGDTDAAGGEIVPLSAAARAEIPDQVLRDKLAGAGGGVGVGEPSRLAPTGPTTPEPTADPQRVTSAAAGDTAAADTDESSVPAPALAGGGLLAAALVAILSHRRWWHARRRKPGTTPPPPPDSRVARMLHDAADADMVTTVNLALRDLAAHVDPADAPPIAAVYVLGRKVHVLFDHSHPVSPPEGWTATDDHEWTRDLDVDDVDDPATALAAIGPLPALVSIGADARGGLLLVDLERATVTSLVGEPDDVAATMTALTLELAGSDVASVLEVVCVGFGAELADDLLRVRHVDVDDVEDLVAELDARPYPDDGAALGPRLDGWFDMYTPVVVIDPTGSADLAACARRHPQAVTALVTSGQPGEWTLTLDGPGKLAVDSPTGPVSNQWIVDRPDLDQATINEIVALLAGAGDTVDYEELSDTIRANPIDIRSRDTGRADPRVEWPPVVVRILGEVRIEGATGPAVRRPTIEMVAYLALNRHRVPVDTLSEMLWPGLPAQSDRLYRISTDARHVLGIGADGQPRLPSANGHGYYSVTDEVGTDLDIFEDLVDQARGLAGAAARTHLHTALDLVEGEPFSGPGQDFSWAQTGPAFEAAIAVEQAASSLGELYLDDDDADTAEWAARQGLRAMPGSERLYAVRMRAAAGDTRRLEMLMREVTAVLGVDDGPDSNLTVPDELQQLYNELRQPQRAAI